MCGTKDKASSCEGSCKTILGAAKTNIAEVSQADWTTMQTKAQTCPAAGTILEKMEAMFANMSQVANQNANTPATVLACVG